MAAKKAPQVNDLIFKELIKRGCSVDGKTRVWNLADSKLWYLSEEQAQKFIDLKASKTYKEGVVDKEATLVSKSISDILSSVDKKGMNVFDITARDGKKAEGVLRHLCDDVKIKYYPTDFHEYMTKKATERMKALGVEEVKEYIPEVSKFKDFSKVTKEIRKDGFKKTMIFLLGNSLGNFEINEMLFEIRKSMKEGDILLIGNALNNESKEEILQPYGSREIRDFFIEIPKQLGITEDQLEFKIDLQNSRVEISFILKDDVEVKRGWRKVKLKKRDNFLVCGSAKYTKKDMLGFLNMYFDDVQLLTTPGCSYALALCKK
jgi:hypothetical protein